ncbi:protein translocase SEC61 complex subunit gamma [Pyrodictium occultum]|nr:protein translocase SEC61 complex subunit gamma [Pyrodictium occultum]
MAARERESIIDYVKATLHEWRLVLQRVEKPDSSEYLQASKVIWLAIILVGSVAYVIHLVATTLLTG